MVKAKNFGEKMLRRLNSRHVQVRASLFPHRSLTTERRRISGLIPLLIIGRDFSSSSKVSFKCSSCGRETSRWLGQCPQCKNWNTFTETVAAPQNREIGKVERERSKWIGEEGAQIESLSKQATVSQNHRYVLHDLYCFKQLINT